MTENNLNNCSRIYFLPGNARTFLNCFDSLYENIIDKLFENNNIKNTHVLFYLKCDNSGENKHTLKMVKKNAKKKFKYEAIEEDILKNGIEDLKIKYKNITFHTKILLTNEISDNDLLSQVKSRDMYDGIFSEDNILLRALHCHYNIEQCGKIIDKLQIDNKILFDYFIYVRPDLFFTEPCNNIKYFNQNKIINAKKRNKAIDDYMAIIPKKFKSNFFEDRMKLVRNNIKYKFTMPEEIYWFTIKDNCEKHPVGKYGVMRSKDCIT